jgi:tRNA wybutosine-synthesizing protein 2
LLPTSEGSWETALGLVSGEGWLHLHENVGVHDVEARRGEIEDIFRGWLREANDERRVTVEHVEFVKTFAPGVWHCVFDVCVTSPESSK